MYIIVCSSVVLLEQDAQRMIEIRFLPGKGCPRVLWEATQGQKMLEDHPPGWKLPFMDADVPLMDAYS